MTGTTNAIDWSWLIALLIIAGIFGNGFGFGGNARTDISNEFLYNQLANDVRANGQAIATTDRDVLTSSCNTDKDVLLGTQSVISNQQQLALQNQAQMSSCCCEIKSLIRDEAQSVKDLINNNTIQDLRDQLNTATVASANAVQTQNILGNLGRFYINQPINPYYAYGNYGSYGTTII